MALNNGKDDEKLSFSSDFKFGAAVAAYQIEGGWNLNDKSTSIWDDLTHDHPDYIKGGSTGNVACDSINLWKRDVEMLVELGVNTYRFSLSWPRILPNGFPTHVSKTGVKYYSDLIDALLEKGIEPIVTIYHWDLPSTLQKYGGWNNPLISDWFADYARVVFNLYGKRVKTWITINEPSAMCDLAYNEGRMAPGIRDREVSPYLTSKHVVMAHAKAYRIYDQQYRKQYGGRVSIVTIYHWFEPVTEKDANLADLALLNMGRTAHPIFSKEGGWPRGVEEAIEETCKKLGYARSNLPPFTDEEKKFVRGTYDFFGLNYYTSRIIRPAKPGETPGTKGDGWTMGDCPDLNAMVEFDNSLKRCDSSWLYIDPKGIRKLLNWVNKQYEGVEIVITENGYSGRNDQDRTEFYKDHLQQVLLAIKDGVNVTGYIIWSLMDNFEWMDGYESKFGLYEVDFTSSMRTRKPRPAAHYYANVIKNRTLE